MTEPSQAIFLSYASEDAEAAARIAEALKSAGLEVWFDRSELRGGEAWDRHISHQISACGLFLALVSAHTDERSEGYFRREWRAALERMRDMADDRAFLVPVAIDDTHLDMARVPDRFREFHWLRLPAGETPPAAIVQIRRLLSPPEPGRPGHRSASMHDERAVLSPRRAAWWKPALLVAGLATVAAGAYLGYGRHALSQHGPAAATAASEKSIAVLPFADLSEKHDQQYFADGMAEEIINQLVNVPGLKVIGRGSSFRFKGQAEDLRQIGSTLGAAFLVEGSVRRSGSHVRITAQLTDARDGTQRWSETYDREVHDVLAVQDEITSGLVRALQVEVIGAVSGVKPRIQPKSPEAYDAYLRALHAFDRFDDAGFNEALTYLKRALDLDPSFIPAAELLARINYDQPTWGFVAPAVGFERARAAANSVLELDPNSAVGHAVLAGVHLWYDWDWAAARKEIEISLAQARPDAFSYMTVGMERIAAGQVNEAVRVSNTALTIDPLLPSTFEVLNWAYLRSGQYAESEAAARRMLQISPTFTGAHRDLGDALLMQHRPREALAAMQDEPWAGRRQVGLVLAYLALDQAQDAAAALARLESEHSMDMAMGIAEVYAVSGKKDLAFRWLDRAYAQKDVFLWSIMGDPFLRSLEADPRHKAFLEKMNLLQ